MERGYIIIDPDLGPPKHNLSEDIQVRILSYLIRVMDKVVTIPEGLQFEVIPVEYLGGPYPGIGACDPPNQSSSRSRDEKLTDWSFIAGKKLAEYIEETGTDRLAELSASEPLTWNDVLQGLNRG